MKNRVKYGYLKMATANQMILNKYTFETLCNLGKSAATQGNKIEIDPSLINALDSSGSCVTSH